jgi:hypothetical protein
MEPDLRLKISLISLTVGELPGCDFPVLRYMYVEMMRQIFMLFVIDPEVSRAAMIHMFEFGSL